MIFILAIAFIIFAIDTMVILVIRDRVESRKAQADEMFNLTARLAPYSRREMAR